MARVRASCHAERQDRGSGSKASISPGPDGGWKSGTEVWLQAGFAPRTPVLARTWVDAGSRGPRVAFPQREGGWGTGTEGPCPGSLPRSAPVLLPQRPPPPPHGLACARSPPEGPAFKCHHTELGGGEGGDSQHTFGPWQEAKPQPALLWKSTPRSLVHPPWRERRGNSATASHLRRGADWLGEEVKSTGLCWVENPDKRGLLPSGPAITACQRPAALRRPREELHTGTAVRPDGERCVPRGKGRDLSGPLSVGSRAVGRDTEVSEQSQLSPRVPARGLSPASSQRLVLGDPPDATSGAHWPHEPGHSRGLCAALQAALTRGLSSRRWVWQPRRPEVPEQGGVGPDGVR